MGNSSLPCHESGQVLIGLARSDLVSNLRCRVDKEMGYLIWLGKVGAHLAESFYRIPLKGMQSIFEESLLADAIYRLLSPLDILPLTFSHHIAIDKRRGIAPVKFQ